MLFWYDASKGAEANGVYHENTQSTRRQGLEPEHGCQCHSCGTDHIFGLREWESTDSDRMSDRAGKVL